MLKSGHTIEPEELMAYLDGELEIERAAAAAEHLERCAECRKVAEEFRGVSRALMSWEVEESRLSAVAAPQRVLRWWQRKPVWAATAIMACAAVAFWIPARRSRFGVAAPQGIDVDQVRSRGEAFVLNGSTNGLLSGNSTMFVPPAPSAPAGRKIARSAELELRTPNLDAARQSIESYAVRHHGYIGGIDIKTGSAIPHWLSATVQVPSPELSATLSDLRRLGQVVSESQVGDDVTARSIDLDARLSNARIAEQRMKEILQQRPGKISDVLEVEREITRVRGEIEQMEAEHKDLTARVEFASISVKVNQPVAEPQRGLGAAARSGWRTLIDELNAVAEAMLTAGPTILLCAVILVFPVRFAWKRLRKRSDLSA